MRSAFLLLAFISNLAYGQLSIPIEITLTGMPDDTFFYLNDDNVNIDSAFSKSERIKFSYRKDGPKPKGLLIVSKDRKQGYVFWIENIPTRLKGTYGDLKDLQTEDSKTQAEFKEYKDKTSPFKNSLNQVRNKLSHAIFLKGADSSVYKKEAGEIANLLKEANISFFKKYPNSVISAISLSFEAQSKRFTNEEIITAFNQLSKEQQNSKEAESILRSVLLYKNPTIGEKAPDFVLTDPDSIAVSLSAFKGKNIVLIFWASWCPPCMQELPAIAELYEEYKANNVVFVAVSLDEKKERWIKNMNRELVNLSDLKGWGNEAALVYGVSGIPQKFLIDTDGKLLAKGGLHLIKESLNK